MDYLIVLIIGILTGYLLYKFFDWLLIDKDPTLNMDRSSYKPNFFARENEKLIKKDQNKFTLTEISNGTQLFDKTTRNDLINSNILIYNNKRVKS